MPEAAAPGLREQKKVRTRAAIAAAAAGLFARDGYPSVTMAQIAAESGVSDQTLYNYFPTKESLVFDRSADFAASLTEALTARPAVTASATQGSEMFPVPPMKRTFRDMGFCLLSTHDGWGSRMPGRER